MKILIIGSGGREHTMAWKCAQSPRVETIYVAPGNAGTTQEPECQNIDIAADDIKGLCNFAIEKKIDLTIVGPEQPLVDCIVNTFQMNNLPIFGPSYAAAQLEGSKVFAKKFMDRHDISTSPWRVLEIDENIEEIFNKMNYPFVIKADHLCAGKGVFIARSAPEAINFVEKLRDGSQCGSCAKHVVIEDLVTGKEVSFMCVVDKNGYKLPLESSQDYKARDNGGYGPNTGGMGACSPSPIITPELTKRIMTEVINPTVAGMKKDGCPFVGFLYAGLMIGNDGSITVLEYNVRMGDPETQPLLMRLRSDFVEMCLGAINGTLDQYTVNWDPRPALGVVLAARGYPDAYEKGFMITGFDAMPESVTVFHAGTTLYPQDQVKSTGGRVLSVTTLANNLQQARGIVYGAIERIHSGDNLFCRTDIGVT